MTMNKSVPLTNEHGAVLVATGPRHFAEARTAILSLRQQMPHLAIALFSDSAVTLSEVSHTVRIDNPSYGFMDKVRALSQTPYARTLFLDTDTYVCAALDDLFAMLDRFDIAFALAPRRFSRIHGAYEQYYPVPGVPATFPEPNTGVLVFQRGPEVDQILQRWQELYSAQLAAPCKPHTDQAALRQAIYESTARFFILPPEYNFRTVFPQVAGMAVSILHGHDADFPAIARELNADPLDLRWYVPGEPVHAWDAEKRTRAQKDANNIASSSK